MLDPDRSIPTTVMLGSKKITHVGPSLIFSGGDSEIDSNDRCNLKLTHLQNDHFLFNYAYEVR